MADNEVQVKITGDATGAEGAMNDASDAVKSGASKMQDSFEGLGGAIEDIQGRFKTAFDAVGITLAYEAIRKVSDGVAELAERATQMKVGADTFGITTTSLQGLQQMALESGVGVDQLQRTMTTLESRMRTAGEMGGQMAARFNALGISTEQLRDPSFSVVDAMQAIGSASNSNAEILALLGTRGAALLPVLRDLAANHNATAEAASRVNALMPDEIASLEKYHETVATAETQLQNFESRLAIGVLPALKEMIREFEEVVTGGGPLSDLFSELGKWLGAAVVDATALAHAFVGAFDVIINGASLVVEAVKSVGASLVAATQLEAGDAVGASQTLSGAFDKVGTAWKKLNDDFETDVARGDNAIHRMEAAVAGLDEVQVSQKKISVGEDLLPDLSKQIDKAQQVTSKWAEDEIGDANKVLDAMRKSAEEGAAADEESKLGQIQANEKALSQQLKDGEVSATQFLAQENALIQQKLDAEVAYLQKKKDLEEAAGRDTGQIDLEITKAYANALKEKQAAENQAQQASLAQWKQLGQTIENSFMSNMKGMIEGTKTFGQAIRSVFASVIDGVISMFLKMAVQWAENMLTQQLLGKATAVSNISANAGIAATGAMASVAAIPYYGWAMAAEVGASTFADAMSYQASASAAGGYDIPSGVNPVTQLYQKEMVLPAPLADSVRAMTGMGKRAPPIKFPGKQVGNVFMMHMDDLKGAVNQLVRTTHGRAGVF